MHTASARRLRIVRFSSADRPRYVQWDQLRTDIFAGELGWKMRRRPPDGDVSDPHDLHGVFFSAEYEEQPIGILRAVHVADGFPHRELFQHHLTLCDLDHRLHTIGTVNALAVLPQYRGITFLDECDDAASTAASHLLRHSLRYFAASGRPIVLATVLSAISARVFIREGFRMIDDPFPSADARFLLANVGRVDADPAHGASGGSQSAEPVVSSYFDARHTCVLGQRDVDELFGAHVTRTPQAG